MAVKTDKSQRSVPIGQLFDTDDLVVDRIYQGGRSGNAGDDRLSKLLGVSNQGGFRYLGSLDALKLVVVVSSFADSDWPDQFDPQTGVLVYFGDNKRPGRDLHATGRGGNGLLRNLFALAHGSPNDRARVPPVLAFANTGEYRDVRFLGLAVPGGIGLTSNEDLVAVWRTTDGQRFQNYRSTFTILDVPALSRAWLTQIQTGASGGSSAPAPWLNWIKRRTYQPLAAQPTATWRTRAQQLPESAEEMAVVTALHAAFRHRPIAFEHCAAEIVRLMDDHFRDMVVTRPTRDGGRDATGVYTIGRGASAVSADFALEAKCYALKNAVGVREVSRLISRLRHRQFGVLITTSYLHEQAYKEIKDDQHPVVVISAVDIARLLLDKGIGQQPQLAAWLDIWKEPD